MLTPIDKNNLKDDVQYLIWTKETKWIVVKVAYPFNDKKHPPYFKTKDEVCYGIEEAVKSFELSKVS